MPASAALISTCTALIAANVALGGAIYEALIVDRAWPATPTIIQPAEGGLNRRIFWFPVHLVFELPLAVAIWACWGLRPERMYLLVAACFHFVLRAWSFAYFIPRAVEFEKHGVAPDRIAGAQMWVRLSRWRILLECGTLAGTAAAAFSLITGS